MEKNRLEAFSDGVLAIVITIMILELKQPVSDGLKDFLALGPTLLAYLISFLFIAIYWVNHHMIFQKAKVINVKILWCNIAWLFVMSFIPFAMAWAGSYPMSWAPLSFYFADMSLAGITFQLMDCLIKHENGEPCRPGCKSIASLTTYIAAAELGGLCPMAAYLIVAAVSCWWIVPEKRGKDSKNN